MLESLLARGTAGAEHRAWGGPGGAGESRTLIPGWTTGWPVALAREGQLRDDAGGESKIVLS